MAAADSILKDALNLKPAERALLIDKLISSLDKPDLKIDELWKNESEARIDAYDQGQIKAVSLQEVLEKYK